MSIALPDIAKKLLDAKTCVTVATVGPDGGPQTSVVWATYDGDDLLISTIAGRAKERNWRRTPRASVMIFAGDDPYRYVEVRGRVSLSTDGADELIERLAQHYTGSRFADDDGTDHVRVIARVTADRVVTHGLAAGDP